MVSEPKPINLEEQRPINIYSIHTATLLNETEPYRFITGVLHTLNRF